MVHFSHDYLNMPLQRGGKVITRLHYIVNLTEARQRYGPGLKGYNTVKSFDDRLSVVEELGGFSCALNLKNEFGCGAVNIMNIAMRKIGYRVWVWSEMNGLRSIIGEGVCSSK